MTLPLTSNQQAIFDLCESTKDNVLITGPPGCGKCLGKGTKVMMYEGGFKKAEEVIVGDLLMGPDSKHRKVLELSSGFDDLYEVVQNRAMNYVVNREHVLSLKRNPGRPLINGRLRDGKFRTVQRYPEYPKIANIKIGVFMGKSASFKRVFSGYKVPVDYSEKPLDIDPYFLGLWLGDGTSRHPSITTMDQPIVDWLREYSFSIGHVLSQQSDGPNRSHGKASSYRIRTQGNRKAKDSLINKMRALDLINNKHIPWDYLYNSKENRLKLLAGLIDTDGHFERGQYELVQVRKELLEQVKILCDGLGFKTRITEKIVNGVTYYRLFFSGNTPIPVSLQRKKNTDRRNKDHSVTRIDEINFMGKGEYYGFSVDGDHLFCLEDGTVTHNSVLNNALLKRGKKKYVMSAPTGLAAINVNGETLHRLFKIPVSDGIIEPGYNKFNDSMFTIVRLQMLKVLIIDEISMVRVDVIEFIDRMLRSVRGKDVPFGGVQIIAVGDFYQLPPVMRDNDEVMLNQHWESPYMFSSRVFGSFRTAQLSEVLRQKGDTEFIDLLHSARGGRLSEAEIARLNSCVGPVEDTRIRLVAVNRQADEINQKFLGALTGPSTVYTADVMGSWPANPVDVEIALKVGAQVMVRLNGADLEAGKTGVSIVVNGTIGTVLTLEPKKIRIVTEDGEEAWIYRKRFERRIKEYVNGDWTERLVASFEQIPVMLAWATSLHKSQGQSFDHAHIDASRVFAAGQTYVGVSRIRSLVGMSLEHPLRSEHFIVDKKVLNWDKALV